MRHSLIATISLGYCSLNASLPLETPRLQSLGAAPRSYDFAFATRGTEVPDVLVADFLTPSLQNYPYNGTNFVTPSILVGSAAEGNKFVQTADVDGDDRQDIVLLGNSSLQWLRKNSITGTFESPVGFTVLNDDDFGGPLTGMQTVEVEDFNRDGLPDLLVASSSEISLYLQVIGSGEYVRAVVFRGYSIQTLHVADLNGDLHPDLLTNQGGSLGVSYWNQAENNFGAPSTLPSGNIVVTWTQLIDVGRDRHVATKDLDGDGWPELFVPNNMTWYRGIDPATSAFNQPFDLSAPNALTTLNANTVHIDDVNGDGFLDFLALADGQLWTAAGAEGMAFDTPQAANNGRFSIIRTQSSADLRIHTVDLDRDGDKDVILPPVRVNNATNGTLIYETNAPAVVEVSLGYGKSYAPSFVEGSAFAQIDVVLDRPAPFDVTVTLVSANDTAIAGQDYTAFFELVTVPAGQTTAALPIFLFDDIEFNGSRSFNVTMSNPTPAAPGGTLGYAVLGEAISGVVTIEDDERVTLTVAESYFSVEELREVLTIDLVAESSLAAFPDIQVDFETAAPLVAEADAAEIGTDYTATAGSLTFNTQGQIGRITIPIIDDSIQENTEGFRLLLSTTAPFADFFYEELIIEIFDDDISFAEAASRSFLPPDRSGPMDDASGDGIPNLMAWALGLPLTSVHPDSEPIVEVGSGRNVTALAPLSFQIPDPARLDVAYTVEQLSADGSWQSILVKEGRGPWTGEATFASDSAASGSSQESVYATGSPPFLLRLRVGLTP